MWPKTTVSFTRHYGQSARHGGKLPRCRRQIRGLRRPGLVLAGRTDVSLTKAVATVDKVSANVHLQLSLAERNYTLGSVVGVGLRYAVEQQAVPRTLIDRVVSIGESPLKCVFLESLAIKYLF